MFSSNHNIFPKSTDNKFGNVPHVNRLNLERHNITPSEPNHEPVISEWDKLEISKEEYYDNILQPITTKALEIKKEISTIIVKKMLFTVLHTVKHAKLYHKRIRGLRPHYGEGRP